MGSTVIVGAGAIGCWLATKMTIDAHHGCTLVVRSRAGHPSTWVETLTVETPDDALTAQVRVTDDLSCLREAEHIFLCLKESDVDEFLINNEHLIVEDSRASVVFMASRFPDWSFSQPTAGQAADRIRRSLFESGRMVGFACWVGASTLEKGRVRQDGSRGELFVGPLTATSEERAKVLHQLLETHGVPVRWRQQILADVWVKAANSFVWNSMALLTNWDNGHIGGDPLTAALTLQALQETDALAKALNIEVRTPAAKRFAATASAAHHKMSMLQDVERGRETEYPQLYGSFVTCKALAADHEYPVLTTLASLCGAITRRS